MQETPSFQGKVLEWLEKQGYPLEMRVAALWRSRTSFEVRQGWHYSDVETGQSREIDVSVTSMDPLGLAAIHVSVECKATTKPWILFTSNHTVENYSRFLAFGLMSGSARKALVPAALSFGEVAVSEEVRSACRSMPWFWGNTGIGYTLVQAFDGNSDVPYAATTAAVKAAIGCLTGGPGHDSSVPFMVSFPAVVTTSPLLECFLDDRGEPQIKEIERGFLFYQRRISGTPPIKVAVISERGLSDYVDECRSVISTLMSVYAPEIEKVYENLVRQESEQVTPP